MTAVASAPAVVPGHGAGLLDVVRRRYLLQLLVRKELRVRYHGSVLGLAWSYVKPGVQYVVYFLALGVFLRLREVIPDFAVYLFSGMIVVNLFSEALGNATRSVLNNADLVKKIYLPRELFPVASVWVAIVHFVPQLVVLLVGAVVAGWRPQVVPLLAAVAGFLVVLLLATGLGLLCGAVNTVFRDLENLVDLLLMVAVWISPVLYSWQQVAATPLVADNPVLLTIYQLNPVTVAVELFHWAFWLPGSGLGPEVLPPHLLWHTAWALGVAVLVLALGQAVFRRLEGRFAQEL
ncbi:ABC transporter permease [Quadrisphaera sp. DSM 44207]|uniref:ABC transporter permease n=1 Tax=Quadrisphaera sp. DSM 44207 TaxID=1881057 RepID=UPI000887A955|nr:ABC transporter permease [Quadrisphaera sp. DSM 44207]SDQ09735.1 ABC-2 type transport system permease protein [Quadrisphaera sp. DSM 44207]